jgi:hypothetical protein
VQARLLRNKALNQNSLETIKNFAWAPAREVHFRAVEDNYFVVQTNCIRYNYFVVPRVFSDGIANISQVPLDQVHAWVKILDTHDLYNKLDLVKGMSGKMGKMIHVDMNPGSKFVRVGDA